MLSDFAAISPDADGYTGMMFVMQEMGAFVPGDSPIFSPLPESALLTEGWSDAIIMRRLEQKYSRSRYGSVEGGFCTLADGTRATPILRKNCGFLPGQRGKCAMSPLRKWLPIPASLSKRTATCPRKNWSGIRRTKRPWNRRPPYFPCRPKYRNRSRNPPVPLGGMNIPLLRETTQITLFFIRL